MRGDDPDTPEEALTLWDSLDAAERAAWAFALQIEPSPELLLALIAPRPNPTRGTA